MRTYARLRKADAQASRDGLADCVEHVEVVPIPPQDCILLVFDEGTRAEIALQLDDDVARKLLADLQTWAREGVH